MLHINVLIPPHCCMEHLRAILIIQVANTSCCDHEMRGTRVDVHIRVRNFLVSMEKLFKDRLTPISDLSFTRLRPAFYPTINLLPCCLPTTRLAMPSHNNAYSLPSQLLPLSLISMVDVFFPRLTNIPAAL